MGVVQVGFGTGFLLGEGRDCEGDLVVFVSGGAWTGDLVLDFDNGIFGGDGVSDSLVEAFDIVVCYFLLLIFDISRSKIHRSSRFNTLILLHRVRKRRLRRHINRIHRFLTRLRRRPRQTLLPLHQRLPILIRKLGLIHRPLEHIILKHPDLLGPIRKIHLSISMLNALCPLPFIHTSICPVHLPIPVSLVI